MVRKSGVTAVGAINPLAASGVGGAIGGTAGGAIAGAITGAIGGAVGGAVGNAVGQKMTTGCINIKETLIASGAGALTGAAFGSIGGAAGASLGIAGQMTGGAGVATAVTDLALSPINGVANYSLNTAFGN